MQKSSILAFLFWVISAAPCYATDVSAIELEGVSLKMTVTEAQGALRQHGYRDVTTQRSAIEEKKSVAFVKDEHRYVLLEADHFIDSDIRTAEGQDSTVTGIKYLESANIIGAKNKAEPYLCPLGLKFYERYCLNDGGTTCSKNDGYRKMDKKEISGVRTHHLTLTIESSAVCGIELRTVSQQTFEETMRYRRQDTSFLNK